MPDDKGNTTHVLETLAREGFVYIEGLIAALPVALSPPFRYELWRNVLHGAAFKMAECEREGPR